MCFLKVSSKSDYDTTLMSTMFIWCQNRVQGSREFTIVRVASKGKEPQNHQDKFSSEADGLLRKHMHFSLCPLGVSRGM